MERTLTFSHVVQPSAPVPMARLAFADDLTYDTGMSPTVSNRMGRPLDNGLNNRTERTDAPPRLRNQRGQTLRTKGLQTRQRIISAVLTLLGAERPRDLAAAEVARAAGMSIASFYSYFRDVTEVLLAAAEQASEAGPDLTDVLSFPWTGDDAPDRVRTMIERLVEHNIEHYAVVHVRNNLADEGDARFAAIRSRQARPIVEMLSRQIATEGRLERDDADDLSAAFASASLLYGMVERIATLLVQQPYNRVADREELLSAAARIILTVTHGSFKD